MKSLGQIAFEAYREAKHGEAYNGTVIPEWKDVSDVVKAAWDVAAAAVAEMLGQRAVGLVLTEREVREIKHAIFYANECGHGTTGHNQLILIAKFAQFMGFMIRVNDMTEEHSAWTGVDLPNGVEVRG